MTDPLLVDIAGAARMLNISLARARRMVTTNSMPGLVRLGTRSQRVSIRVLEAWIESEAAAATPGPGAAKQVRQRPPHALGDAEGAATSR
jgi:hypothetical protein